MKTFTRKLFISMIAVVFAFIALGTSTFAWFSMNTRVDVSGMEIGARSNNTFLLIGGTYGADDAATIAAIKAANENTRVTYTLTAAESTVLPSKPLEAEEIGADQTNPNNPATGKLFASGTPVTDYATAAVPANWYTAANNNPLSSTDSIKEQHTLVEDGTTGADADYVFSNYVIKKTVYLTLATGANNAQDLTVTGNIALKAGQDANKTDITGVKVLVVTDDDNMVKLDASNEINNNAQNLHGTVNTILTDSTLVKVAIYVYYDGSEDNVKTDNAAILAAATIELTFGVSVING